MDDANTIVEDGAVAISAGVISHVGDDALISEVVHAERVIDAAGAPVHPGFVEGHVHASYHMYRGAIPDQLEEADVYEDINIAFLNGVTEEEEHLGVLLAAMEMIRAGTTCFMEAGTIFSPDAAAAAAQRVGIRAVLADPFVLDEPEAYAQGKGPTSIGAKGSRTPRKRAPTDLDGALARMGRELRRNSDPDALVTGHVAVPGLGMTSEALLLAAKELADASGAVMNMHQSYSAADAAADRDRYGEDPLVHLSRIGVLDRNLTLGHANRLSDAECDAVLATGASLVWAPAASMMWAHGSSLHGRHAELWRRGANIALGSDSGNWSNNFDLFRQANLALLTSRDVHGDRLLLIAEDMLEMATRGGARAVGMDHKIGSIEVGKRADIVIHTLDRPELAPVTNMARNLMYSSGSRAVSSVIVDGDLVLDRGEFVRVDEKDLLAEISSASRSMLNRLNYVVQPNRRS